MLSFDKTLNSDEKKIDNPLPPLPKKIHFIWVGGPIPGGYLTNILKLTNMVVKNGFEVNIWVDDEKNISHPKEKSSHVILEGQVPKIPGLKIRNINELHTKIKNDPFFKENDRYKALASYINKDMVGFKNLAAVSDLLRYVILYLEGGCYTDTDVKFIKIKQPEFIKENPLSAGFAVNFGAYGDSFPYFTRIEGNNDVIVSLPQHPVMKDAICASLAKLKEYENTELRKINYSSLKATGELKLTQMDGKRWPYSITPRLSRTVDSTGPVMFRRVIEDHWEKHIGLLDKATLHEWNRSIFCAQSAELFIPEVYFNTEDQHGTWFKNPKKRVHNFDGSFDDGEITKGRFKKNK